MYQPHEDLSPNFFDLTGICRNRNQGWALERALISVVMASLSVMVAGLLTQRDTSRLLATDLTSPNTVFTNLFIPRKVLAAT